MSETTQSKQSIGRFSIGFNVLLQILLGVFLFTVINYLSWRNYKRWDLTTEQSHTLSQRTINFLENLDKKARITVLFTRGTPLTENVYNLVDEYKRHAGKKLKVDYINPARDPQGLEALKQEYKIEFPDRKDGLLIEMEVDGSRQIKFLTEDQFLQEGRGRANAFTGEIALTSALLSLTEGRKKVLKLVTGKGKVNEGEGGATAMDFLQEFAARENGEVQIIDISNSEEDLRGADVLLFINIRDDLSENEVARLREYWEGKRGGLFFLLNPEYDTPRLKAFLKEYGILVQNDRVVEAVSDSLKRKVSWKVHSVILPGTEILDSQVGGRNLTFRGKTQSIKIDTSRKEELQDRGVAVVPLLQTDYSRFWGETDEFREPIYDEDEDTGRGPLTGVYAEMGVVKDAKLRIESSRMVVLGNSTLLDPTLDKVSYDLATSVLNWMLDRDELVGIAPKEKRSFRLEVADIHSRRVFQIVIIALPLAVIFFGLFVWSMRRA